ncbi:MULTISPECIES: hypothetical protein [Variovorax]|jgi:hypothetical protein|uniref:hypothetical protein n=1 Tax=Variovorax TaxID=34072 RepID=UPI000868A1D5|nr:MULTISPECIES: hypothetical protein [Variovorax]MBN8756199.1 hypothetical protein [Variovorax sp.]ODU16540.1 MAG: hypothetical protein ABS94_12770 [Variovorax sp. SCN 67-85]ODV23745.1 MAG: hypothetical protein ABT25_17715 [Variovorax sp. SCN 67-20]OJZ13017.1 MAG: hypothetical protein BGP22_24490 [Variovorax sp. 67-131]UKI09606.1 hypothetical protein L3V85_07085 [Variovorax paradoxus]
MAQAAPAPAQPRACPASPNLDDLALQACDDAENLNDVMRAYAALRKLVDTSALNDSEVLTPSRTELSALLGVLNDAMTVRIDAISLAAGAVREALQGRKPGPA